MTTKSSNTALTMLLSQRPPFVPEGAEAMTVLIELPPGDPGAPPHRHSGPVFGYMLEGEIIFELEGEPEQVIRAGKRSGNRAGTSSTTRPPTTSPTGGAGSWW
jgi:quercetin dioxygenase-like cupin family protein